MFPEEQVRVSTLTSLSNPSSKGTDTSFGDNVYTQCKKCMYITHTHTHIYRPNTHTHKIKSKTKRQIFFLTGSLSERQGDNLVKIPPWQSLTDEPSSAYTKYTHNSFVLL